jgi:hypothetical protein
MGLLRKLGVLVGALVHKPFMPRQQKADLDEGGKAPVEEGPPRERPASSGREPDLADGERVADLIARAQREQAD